MSKLIDADKLITDMNTRAEEEYLEFRDIRNMVEYAPTIHAIPLDKVKALIHQLNEEKELAYADFDEYKASVLGIEADELPEDEYRYGIERCLQLLNRLIAEEVEHEQNKC